MDKLLDSSFLRRDIPEYFQNKTITEVICLFFLMSIFLMDIVHITEAEVFCPYLHYTSAAGGKPVCHLMRLYQAAIFPPTGRQNYFLAL